MMRNHAVAAALVAGGVASSALGQVSIITGFDTSSGWAPLLLNNDGQDATILTSGGNPGGYADLRPVITGGTRGGAGMYPYLMFFQLNTPTVLTDVVMSADYRWFSQTGGTLTLDPFLWQGNHLYLPPNPFALGTNTAWTSLDPATFPISSFTTSSGVPLNPGTVQAGFMVVFSSDTPGNFAARVGIDNLNIQIVPSPGMAGVALGAIGAAVPRRRRQVWPRSQ
jgi:hypothetical protein